MRVTQDEGAPGADIVYELVAVLIVDFRAGSLSYEKGISTHGFEGAYRATHPPG